MADVPHPTDTGDAKARAEAWALHAMSVLTEGSPSDVWNQGAVFTFVEPLVEGIHALLRVCDEATARADFLTDQLDRQTENAGIFLRERDEATAELSADRVQAQRVPGLEKALSDECANSLRIVNERQEFIAHAIKSWRDEAEDFERRAVAAETALREIEGIDPEEWNSLEGWLCVSFIQEKARAALASVPTPETPDAR